MFFITHNSQNKKNTEYAFLWCSGLQSITPIASLTLIGCSILIALCQTILLTYLIGYSGCRKNIMEEAVKYISLMLCSFRNLVITGSLQILFLYLNCHDTLEKIVVSSSIWRAGNAGKRWITAFWVFLWESECSWRGWIFHLFANSALHSDNHSKFQIVDRKSYDVVSSFKISVKYFNLSYIIKLFIVI